MLKETGLIIFDIDGTLLDSVDFNKANLNGVLEKRGYSYRVTDERIRSYLGCTAEDFYRGVLDEASYGEWESIRAEARSQAGEMMLRHGKAFEGVYETFETLHKKGIKLVLYSNCSRPYLESAVELIGIGPFLSYTECVKDNGLEKPVLLQKIRDKYKEHHAIVVGDRIHDVEAAKINGIPSVGAVYGYGKDEVKDADFKISRMSDLLGLLED
ncbi:MAG: HAD family hydrolase [Cellulosilyticaceae bacterium]